MTEQLELPFDPSPVLESDRVEVYLGDCLDVLTSLGDSTVDSIVTDPPYGLEFMAGSIDWDRPWAVSPTNKVGYVGRENNLTLPSYGDNRNATCGICGGRMRGAKRHPTPESEPHEAAWKPTGVARTDKRGVIDPKAWGGSQDAPNGGNAYSRSKVRTGAAHYGGDPTAVGIMYQQWCEAWARECLRVLKPGGFIAAFGAPRTYHRLTCAIENAGFEIRDCVMWINGQSFPKGRDVYKIDIVPEVEKQLRSQGVEGPIAWR